MEKRWILKKQGDSKIITGLQETLNIDIHLANLLAQRGINTFDEAKSFSVLSSPTSMILF